MRLTSHQYEARHRLAGGVAGHRGSNRHAVGMAGNSLQKPGGSTTRSRGGSRRVSCVHSMALCLGCGRSLTGRQQKWCSTRCRLRYRQRPGSPPQDLTVPDYIRSGYLLVPNGPLAGEPFALADFQGGFVDEVYAGRGMAVLTTGRGNGKTGLLAAVCMAELDTLPRRKEIISAGLTQLVSDDLRREIEQMAEDVGQPLIGRKDTLQHPHTQSTIFFANGANESGLSRKPDLIVADEVAYTRPNSNRFQTLQTAAAKRPHCRFLCTST